MQAKHRNIFYVHNMFLSCMVKNHFISSRVSSKYSDFISLRRNCNNSDSVSSDLLQMFKLF